MAKDILNKILKLKKKNTLIDDLIQFNPMWNLGRWKESWTQWGHYQVPGNELPVHPLLLTCYVSISREGYAPTSLSSR